MRSATIIIILLACLVNSTFGVAAKFLPKENRILMIIGQDLGSVGGFNAPHNNGYYEGVGIVSGGITTYTGFPYLVGLRTPTNYGSGDQCAQTIADCQRYKNCAIVIGLSMTNQLQAIKNGNLDGVIMDMGNWIKDTKRPVFVRIGYEFNGSWNNYTPASDYVAAYKRIVDIWRRENVRNFAAVWQSSGYENSNPNSLMPWYPGDNYVDWIGYSHFEISTDAAAVLSIAKDKNKPIMAAEVTPKGYQIPGVGYRVWSDWFSTYFNHLYKNQEYIRAIAYINANWDAQPMWAGQGWGDTRVQTDQEVLQKWKSEINKDIFLKSRGDLFYQLGFSSSIHGKPQVQSKHSLVLLSGAKQGMFQIKGLTLSDQRISVTNLQGKKVSFGIQNNMLDLRALSSGVYFISIKNQNSMHTRHKCVIP